MKSSFGKINARDILHAFVTAFIFTALTGLIQTLDAGALPTVANLKQAGILGLTAGLSYVLKVLTENSKGQLLKKEK